MTERKVIYYHDELNEEFSTAQIVPRVIDENYRYIRSNAWDFWSLIMQNVLSMPIKVLYAKLKFHTKYVGKEKLKPYRKEAYFLYANHTQPFADTFLPSLAMYPKRNFFIVNPENVSMPGLKRIVEQLGALPIPCDKGGLKNFIAAVEERIRRKQAITIYPEAHIWPYYTGIRPFKAVSFKYPVKLDTPVFCQTNTYHKRTGTREKVDIVCYIDGPFFVNKDLPPKDRQQDLRDRVYAQMVERSKQSTYEHVLYRRAEEAKENVLP